MIAERLDLRVDLEALRQAYAELAAACPPVVRNNGGYGGWTLLGPTTEYRDGWTDYSPHASNGWDERAALRRGFRAEATQTVATACCRGAWAALVRRLADLGLAPARVRVAVLRAGRELAPHREAPPGTYMVRLHVPILTNPACAFVCNEGEAHLPADGAGYLVRVNRTHKAVNHGPTDRVHLMATIWDRAGVSQHHRMPT